MLDYHCTICNRAIGYEGFCWKCKAEKDRKDALSLTEAQIQERQKYLIEHVQELGKERNLQKSILGIVCRIIISFQKSYSVQQ